MTADERARMKHTLQTALRTSVLPGAAFEHPGPMAMPATTMSNTELVARFEREFTTVGGTCHHLDDVEAIANLIATLASAQGSNKVLVWEEAALPVVGLASRLASLGVTVGAQSANDMVTVDGRRELATYAVGVTGAHAALAESGSIVVVSGPGRGRLASLLPPMHVALVKRRDVAYSLAELLARTPALATAGSNLVCITGPSRTADIEHTLARGVHGPKELHVVLVD